ncbi:MAG: 3-isopropylmalate dehydratase small subunit [Gammaproteobacteria bacterium]|nr:3-isopropylmalate dehydratase small subunit [Gammaproteobacteria bacterium]
MNPVTRIQSRTVVMANTDIDTDQIIPARYLTTTTREGLGKHLFNDWRYRADGSLNDDFILNKPDSAGCQVLVAGRNFGCGSSREHAPWALIDFGIAAVISSEIADIFRSNALKNGLLPIVVDENTLNWLLDHPYAEVVIDVADSTLTLADGTTVNYPIDRFARYCLLEGIDQLGYLQKRQNEIRQFEENRSWTP